MSVKLKWGGKRGAKPQMGAMAPGPFLAPPLHESIKKRYSRISSHQLASL